MADNTVPIYVRTGSTFFCQARGCRRPRNKPFKTSRGLKQHQKHCMAYKALVQESYEVQMESINAEAKRRRLESTFDDTSFLDGIGNDTLGVRSFVAF